MAALPAERYRVEKYLVADPADTDGDCIDDITELNNMGEMNPVNPGVSIDLSDGAVALPDRETFQTLASASRVKFVVLDIDTEQPKVYFQNMRTHRSHEDLLAVIGASWWRAVSGVLRYYPSLAAPDGSLGTYAYAIFYRGLSFSLAERVHTALAASMPLLDGDLAIRISDANISTIPGDLPLYAASRIRVLGDEDIGGTPDFTALNPGLAFGLLRSPEPDDRPHPRDIVIYEVPPNDLPRVAGIISTAPQTPLSHINLRAIQDGTPNAHIADAREDDNLSDLIGSHVRYEVTGSGYSIRSATQAEVDAHYAVSRPTDTQAPQRDLSVTGIKPLSEVGFDDWDSFGVKAANVCPCSGGWGSRRAPCQTGFAIPFYFYDEFMKHNGLYDDVEGDAGRPDFRSDYDTMEWTELKKLAQEDQEGRDAGVDRDGAYEGDARDGYPEGTVAALPVQHQQRGPARVQRGGAVRLQDAASGGDRGGRHLQVPQAGVRQPVELPGLHRARLPSRRPPGG